MSLIDNPGSYSRFFVLWYEDPHSSELITWYCLSTNKTQNVIEGQPLVAVWALLLHSAVLPTSCLWFRSFPAVGIVTLQDMPGHRRTIINWPSSIGVDKSLWNDLKSSQIKSNRFDLIWSPNHYSLTWLDLIWKLDGDPLIWFWFELETSDLTLDLNFRHWIMILICLCLFCRGLKFVGTWPIIYN